MGSAISGNWSQIRRWIWAGVTGLALATGWVAYRATRPIIGDVRIDNRVILLHIPRDLTGRVVIRQATADDDLQLVSGFGRGEHPRWYDVYVSPDGAAVVDDVEIFRNLKRFERHEGHWSLRAVDADGKRLPCCFASWQPSDQIAFRLYSTAADGTRVALVGDRSFMRLRWPEDSSVVGEMFWADSGWSP